jgi:hypothetical protein
LAIFEKQFKRKTFVGVTSQLARFFGGKIRIYATLSFSQDPFLPHSKEKNMKVATHKKKGYSPSLRDDFSLVA